MLSGLSGRWFSRLCAIYFIASIVVPTTAPFQAVNFSEVLRSATSHPHRLSAAAAASKDKGTASATLRRLDRRSRNRTKSAGVSALAIERDRRSSQSSQRMVRAGSKVSGIPLTALRI
jgi:hypothetical protein